MEMKLWYNTPAQSFCQALPIGNGSLGGMVYGGVTRERISLNLDTLWSGTGQKKIKEIPRDYLDSVRELIRRKEYFKAQQFIEDHMLGDYNESYMPLGNLRYSFEGMNPQKINGYKRSLDLSRAIHRTEFMYEGNAIVSEVFASYPDRCICLVIHSAMAGRLNLCFSLDSVLHHHIRTEDAICYMSGVAPSHVEPNYIVSSNPIVYDEANPGMIFGCMIGLRLTDGTVESRNKGLVVRNASRVEIILSAQDGFRGYDKKPEGRDREIYDRCLDVIRSCSHRGIPRIRERHVADYSSLFNRVDLELYGQAASLPTDLLLQSVKTGPMDLGLVTLFFQYGRYLLISSSREGSQPANLQGIWNESNRPVWSSNYTTNINTQMNYWAGGVCHLSECYAPLVQMVEELRRAGEETAGKQYHCEGWVCNHNTDLWRQTGPVGGCAKYAYWPMGGVWLSLQIYELYLYSGDRKLLQDTLFPILQSAARFCAGWVTREADGKYHTLPSTSPENSFRDDRGRECYVSDSSTMDILLVNQLFAYVIRSYEILGIQDDFYDRLLDISANMVSVGIDREGRLQEWLTDHEMADRGHRHFSPMIGLHMAELYNRETAPSLYHAGRRFLEDRLANGSGHIGWSCAWLISLFSQYGEGEEARKYLYQLLRDSLYDNLFDLHPPLGEGEGEREVFQIDGNLGACFGIARMLLGDCNGWIEILPALPQEWDKGRVRGLLAKNNFECSLEWDKGKMVRGRIQSNKGGVLQLRYQYPFSVQSPKGAIVSHSVREAKLSTLPGEVYELVPQYRTHDVL